MTPFPLWIVAQQVLLVLLPALLNPTQLLLGPSGMDSGVGCAPWWPSVAVRTAYWCPGPLCCMALVLDAVMAR